MQKYCVSCLAPLDEEDTCCPKCGDSSLPSQTFAELGPGDKEEVFRHAKTNFLSAFSFLLAFLVPSLLLLFVSYKYAKDFSELMGFLYLGAIGYCYNNSVIDVFVEKTASKGKLSEAKGYLAAKKWCFVFGILVFASFLVVSYI